MNSIELLSNAKINLSIDVLGKRDDGYHEVEMILHEIDLADIIRMEKRNINIEISCMTSYLPCDERNIVYKAAAEFFKYTNIKEGVGITLNKNIPISAGLGGGSSNAASVLIGLDKLYDTKLSIEELEKLSSRLGSDVPFFIQGGTALCRGRGELIETIKTDVVFDMLVIRPDIAVSTMEIYREFKPGYIKKRPLTNDLIDALKYNDSVTVSKNLVNVLEEITIKLYPEIREIKTKLLEHGALNSLMSGSGSAVFGIFKNKYDTVLAADLIPNGKYQKFIVKTKVR